MARPGLRRGGAADGRPEGQEKHADALLRRTTRSALDFDPTLRLTFDVENGKVTGGKLVQRGMTMNVFRRPCARMTIDGTFRARVLAGEFLTGFWLNLGSPVTAEMAGLAGFDWVMLDHEHGPGGEDDDPASAPGGERDAGDVSRAHRGQRAAAVQARARRGRARRDGAVREHGGGGARRGAVRCAIPPRGMRGVAKLTRASAFGARFDEYFAHAHEWLVTLAQIETVDALENAAEIAEVDGVDVVFVGPMDLTTSMGIPGQYGDARFHDALGEVADAAQSAGKAAGILLLDPANLPLCRELGYTSVALGSEAARVVTRAAECGDCNGNRLTRRARRDRERGELLSGRASAGAALLSIHNPKEDFGVGIQPASRQTFSVLPPCSACSASITAGAGASVHCGLERCFRTRASRIDRIRAPHPSIRSMLRISGAKSAPSPTPAPPAPAPARAAPSPNSACTIHGPARGFRHQSSSYRSTSVSVISAWSCHARR